MPTTTRPPGAAPLVIVTDHLILRDFVAGDFEAMLAYQTDPRYLQYYARDRRDRVTEQARQLLQGFIAAQAQHPRTKYQLAMTLREDGRLIGNVGVRRESVEATEGEMGCEVAPDYWNRGYATEATRAMLNFGFDTLGLHRISATTMAPNTGAWRVLEKLGMKREGELRETTRLEHGWANSLVYGILEHEWRAHG
ncbi:MAG TPA: GNAT family protein [Chloroflexia bacterium]|nr:GNAT family protein [Chloroflexia bacterium]